MLKAASKTSRIQKIKSGYSNSRIRSSSMKIFFLATILYDHNFFILSCGVREEIRRKIFPFFLKCRFACLRNFKDISSPLLPPVVAILESFGSRLSCGRYGALKIIKSK